MASAPPDYYIPSDYDDSPYDQQQQLPHTLTNKLVVLGIIIFFCAIFFISALHVYAKWLWARRHGNPHYRPPSLATLITRQAPVSTGLSKAGIAMLPTFTYTPPPPAVATSDSSASDDASALLQCAVCLSDFEENEKGRTLPACKHSFHIDCIDMWLYSHSTCPLCRSAVLISDDTISTLAGNIEAAGAMVASRGHDGQEFEMRVEEGSAHSEVRIVIENASILSTAFSTHDNDAELTASAVANTAHATGRNRNPSFPPQAAASPSVNFTRHSPGRRLPRITIEIPTRQINIPITSPGCIPLPMSARQTLDFLQESTPPPLSYSPSLKSPGVRATLKKMWSTQAAAAGKGSSLMTGAGILASPTSRPRPF